MNPSAKYTPTESRDRNGGEQHIFKFPNGYTASVIRGPWTYGGDQGLYEIAVLDQANRVIYSTPVTDDVLGYVDLEDVDGILDQISGLEPVA